MKLEYLINQIRINNKNIIHIRVTLNPTTNHHSNTNNKLYIKNSHIVIEIILPITLKINNKTIEPCHPRNKHLDDT